MQRKIPRGRDDEERLTADIVELARRYGRYGYRKITELLRSTAGWVVNDKRVERIWRREGLKVPQKQPKRGRLWLADGSCLRLRAERPDHVWSYDFVEDRTHRPPAAGDPSRSAEGRPALYMFSACCAFGGCGGAIVVIHALDGSRRCREAEEGRACRVG